MNKDSISHSHAVGDHEDAPVSSAEGAGLMAEMTQALQRMQQATADAVELVGRVARGSS